MVIVITFPGLELVRGGSPLRSSAGSEGLTVVIPTYNERDNVEPLFRRLAAIRGTWPRDWEIVVVDDHSPDGTAQRVEELAHRFSLPVRLLRRNGPRSMGRSIVAGIEQSRGGLLCVMDADLSHPPERIPDLLRALDGADGVVASRYAAGGTVVHWPKSRRLISWGATALGRSLMRARCSDPLSGFFLLRRTALVGLTITGIGNKPLLEILGTKALVLHEIPYEFRDRERGSSKLDPKGFVDFTHLLARLSWRAVRGTPSDLLREGEAPAEAHGP